MVDSREWEVRSAEDLGRAIAEIRLQRGMTQAELAALTGLERTYLARLETGLTVKLLDRALRVLRRLGARVTVQFGSDDAT